MKRKKDMFAIPKEGKIGKEAVEDLNSTNIANRELIYYGHYSQGGWIYD
jgi:hypothetical protein